MHRLPRLSRFCTMGMPLALLLALALVVLPSAQTAFGQDDGDADTAAAAEAKAQADQLFKQIEARKDLERCWDYVANLIDLARTMPDPVRDVMRSYENSDNARVRLGVARLKGVAFEDRVGGSIIAIEVLEQALDTLADGDKPAASDAELTACANLLSVYAETDDDIDAVLGFTEHDGFEDLPDMARLTLARTAYVLDGDEELLDIIRELGKSKDPMVRAEVVLTLAEDGRLSEVTDGIKALSMAPDAAGSLARTILENESIKRDIKRLSGNENGNGGNQQPAETFPGLPDYSENNFIKSLTLTVHRFAAVREREVGSKERGNYKLWTVDELLSPKQLLDTACSGMLRHVDQFSQYMTGKQMIEMTEDNEGRYGGVGAYVQMIDGVVTISQPIYEYIVQKEDGSMEVVKGPAYAAGLRSGDQIIGGNGKDFTGWSLEDVIGELKGEPGTPVTVKVMRRGWKEPKIVSVTRAEIEINTAQYVMLPGHVGYIKLLRFGYNSHDDMEEALQALEKAGMKGLVLDLRDNPGGALTAVLEIADKFLSGRKKITFLKGRFGRWARQDDKFTENKYEPRTIPMSVLINGNSASGSELLSGALQDHKRCTVIGEASFGKGVGQAFFYVLASLGQGDADNDDPEYNSFSRWLRLTTFAYYLPSGRSINHVGVQPDIRMDDKIHFKGVHYSCDYITWSGWQLAEVDRLLAQRDANGLNPIDRYIETNFAGNEAKMLKLASYDGFDTAAYPGFDEWYQSLGTTLDKQAARKLLRIGRTPFRTGGLRLACADHRGRDYYQNFQEDPVLQRGIKEIAKDMNLDLGKVPEYKHFSGR